jgi:hypothetical protein
MQRIDPERMKDRIPQRPLQNISVNRLLLQPTMRVIPVEPINQIIVDAV